MLVKLGSIVASASGTLGGAVFKQTRHGTVVAKSPTTTAAPTAAQTAQRTIMQQCAHEWAALSHTQRLSWKNQARNVTLRNRLAIPYHPTGFLWFCELNAPQIMSGAPIMTLPPPPVTPDPPVTFSSSFAHLGPYVISFGAPSQQRAAWATIFIADASSNTIPAAFHNYRRVGRWWLQGHEIGVYDETVAIFGHWEHGHAYAVRCHLTDQYNRPTGTFWTAATVIG